MRILVDIEVVIKHFRTIIYLMISKEKPEGFAPKFEVAACFIEYEGKILFLKRHPEKDYGGFWNLPAGKSDEEEDPLSTAIREAFEETGIALEPEQVSRIESYYDVYPEYMYMFHTYRANVNSEEVTIKEDEATEYGWFTPEEALMLDLVPDEEFCIADFVASKT